MQLLVIPPIFILLGFLDVWVPRNTMVRFMGNGSGLKGVLLAIFIELGALGPLFALTRLFVDIPGIILIAWIMELFLRDSDRLNIVRRVEELTKETTGDISEPLRQG